MSAKKQQLVYLSDDDMAASNIKVGWKNKHLPDEAPCPGVWSTRALLQHVGSGFCIASQIPCILLVALQYELLNVGRKIQGGRVPIKMLVLPIKEVQRCASAVWGANYQGCCTLIGILAKQPVGTIWLTHPDWSVQWSWFKVFLHNSLNLWKAPILQPRICNWMYRCSILVANNMHFMLATYDWQYITDHILAILEPPPICTSLWREICKSDLNIMLPAQSQPP